MNITHILFNRVENQMKYKKLSDNPRIVEVQENGKTKELFIEFPPIV